jgi:hypothetical protein
MSKRKCRERCIIDVIFNGRETYNPNAQLCRDYYVFLTARAKHSYVMAKAWYAIMMVPTQHEHDVAPDWYITHKRQYRIRVMNAAYIRQHSTFKLPA